MNNYATNIDSYSDLTARTHNANTSLLTTLSDEVKQYSISIDEHLKKGTRLTTTAICIIGLATTGSMLVDAPIAPSQSNLYPSVVDFQELTPSSPSLPQGYKAVNESEITSYFLRHPYLKEFLQLNLRRFQNITDTNNLSLEYEGTKEEGWENLYVIVHLDTDDDEHINNIEDALFNEMLNDVPEKITNNLTVSFS